MNILHKFPLHAAAAAVALACFTAQPAQAAAAPVPFGTLAFVQPTGSVGPSDEVEVRLAFTLDAASDPLDFSSDPLTGLSAEALPTEGKWYDPVSGSTFTSNFVSYTGAYLNTFFSCSSTFTTTCLAGPDYNFDFWTSSAPGKPSINFLTSFTLAPGDATEFLFGSFFPAAGGASPGVYTFYNAGLTLNVRGMDADGNVLDATVTTLGETCASSSPACAFTRTVSAVPENGSPALMTLGLLALALRLQRRR